MKISTKFENGSFKLNIDGKEKVYKACIFDFDGTILDTEKYHYATWKRIFSEYGVAVTEEEYIPLKSSGREHIIDVICNNHNIKLTKEQYNKAVAEKGSIYLELSRDLSDKDIINGAIEFFNLLRKNNVKTAIASAGKNLMHMLSRFDLYKYFDAIVDGNGSNRPKPAPDLFEEAAARIEMNCNDCLVFEDSFPGINGAVTGGFDVIGIGGIISPKTIIDSKDYLCFI